jgi:hypothetical protein
LDCNSERIPRRLLEHSENPAKPKETIRLAATLKKTYGKMFLFEVAANVLNRRIAKGTLILASD